MQTVFEMTRRLVFYVDAYSPETIPMAKLAEYMSDFAALLGRENAVHFAGLESGSTQIAAIVEPEDLPKVNARLGAIRHGIASKDITKIFDQIDHRLANDNAVGRIYEQEVFSGNDVRVAAGMVLVEFPGRERAKAPAYGPFNQDGNFDGILIAVGGKDDTISIRLQNGDTTYANCDTTREVARELAKHLFEPVRIHGTGRWVREQDGRWNLLRFRVHRFETLGKGTLAETVAALRAVRSSGWKTFDDPLAELADIRADDDTELH
jgi:hypothetical protein